MLEDGLGCVTTQQVASEELADELNVAEELMLAFHLDVLVVVLGVSLAGIYGSLLEFFEACLREDLLEATTAVVEQLLTELAELQVVRVGFFTLRLEVDLDDCGTEFLTVELGVFVFVLGLAEDGLHYDVEDLVIDREALGLLRVEAFLTE